MINIYSFQDITKEKQRNHIEQQVHRITVNKSGAKKTVIFLVVVSCKRIEHPFLLDIGVIPSVDA